MDSKSKQSPLDANHVLNKEETLFEPVLDDDMKATYASLIGRLLWCAMCTRPDIAYATSVLSKYTKQPRLVHFKAAKRVLRYLKETIDYGLVYTAGKINSLICYSDADWGGDQRKRKSYSGMAIVYSGCLICFKAQQQDVVALSTTEAEYISASRAVQELTWVDRFISELSAPRTVKNVLLCDNQSAIKLIKNPEFHQRSKHIDIKYHHIRDRYEAGLFDLEFIASEDQLADLFTKALSIEIHKGLTRSLGCFAPTLNESEE